MKTIKVKCLYCLGDVEMPVIDNIQYAQWPVIHTDCFKAKKNVIKGRYFNMSTKDAEPIVESIKWG